MDFKCVVLYKDVMVHYRVETEDGWNYKARLLYFKDHPKPPPPAEVMLQKQGMRWRGNADPELVNFLGFDIDQRLRKRALKPVKKQTSG